MSQPASASPAPSVPPVSMLLAFDLDGTLIPEGGSVVPAATRAALARLRALGAQVAVITGRDTVPDDVLDAAQPLAVATNNGGRIELRGQLHHELHFSEAELRAVLAHTLDGARVMAFTRDCVYLDLPPGVPMPEWFATRQHAPLREAPVDRVVKVGFFHAGVSGWKGVLGGSHPHLTMTGAQAPYPDFLTVTPGGADKGAALAAIAGALGVPLERCWAFGDSDNDLAMLSVAGHPVQLGDLPLLRTVARETLSGPDGMAAYLEGLAGEETERPRAGELGGRGLGD